MMPLFRSALMFVALLMGCASDGSDYDSDSASSLEEDERSAALKRLAAADAAFASESRTANWAGEMERALREIFAQEKYLAVAVTDIACKSTACRFEASEARERDTAVESAERSGGIAAIDHNGGLLDAVRSVFRSGPPKSLSSYLIQEINGGRLVVFLFVVRSPVEVAYDGRFGT